MNILGQNQLCLALNGLLGGWCRLRLCWLCGSRGGACHRSRLAKLQTSGCCCCCRSSTRCKSRRSRSCAWLGTSRRVRALYLRAWVSLRGGLSNLEFERACTTSGTTDHWPSLIRLTSILTCNPSTLSHWLIICWKNRSLLLIGLAAIIFLFLLLPLIGRILIWVSWRWLGILLL